MHQNLINLQPVQQQQVEGQAVAEDMDMAEIRELKELWELSDLSAVWGSDA